jgi:hypothetical protein
MSYMWRTDNFDFVLLVCLNTTNETKYTASYQLPSDVNAPCYTMLQILQKNDGFYYVPWDNVSSMTNTDSVIIFTVRLQSFGSGCHSMCLP